MKAKFIPYVLKVNKSDLVIKTDRDKQMIRDEEYEIGYNTMTK